ncbi:MAG: DUF2017 family protein [Verrucomicrobia bacterium]|nr:DUF2017 family protein [Verrucomicrobiota bacterium]
MKFLRAIKSGHVFQLGQHEKHLLLETIKLYPLVPATHHRLSKGGEVPQADENQRLLEDALAEQRQENRRLVLLMLDEPQRFRETKSGFELKLTPAQVEWLLQVLNDVRVGSWLMLGEPESGEEPKITKQNARHLLALELCGLFQSVLLAALGMNESSKWLGD